MAGVRHLARRLGAVQRPPAVAVKTQAADSK